MLSRLRSLWRHLRHRSQTEQDLDAEMSFHLEARTEVLIRAGLSPEEARRRARIEFGSSENYKAGVRESRRVTWLEDFLRDLRYGLRALRKNPGFTTVAILTLALGIGANTTIFTVVNAVLLRQLPYASPDRLAIIWNDFGSQGQSLPQVTPPDLLFYQQASRTLDFAAMYGGVAISIQRQPSARPEVANMNYVSANFFPLMGVPPLLGRNFQPEEAVQFGPKVLMISFGFWQRRFGGDPGAIGKAVLLDGEPWTVIGILPQDFALILPAESKFPNPDLFRPVQIDYHGPLSKISLFFVPARLKPGATFAAAQADMDGIADQIRHQVVEEDSLRIRVVPFESDVVKHVRSTLLILLGAVGFVLLIACANVANLLLTRATARSKEFALRFALGAKSSRIVCQLLAESLLLSLIGGAAGVALAFWGTRLLAAMRPESLQRFTVSMDLRALLFTLAACCVASVAFGIVQAFAGRHFNLSETLKEGGKSSGASGGNKVREMLIVAEIALSLILLTGAALMMQSFSRLQQVSPGFQPGNAGTFGVTLPLRRYKMTDIALFTKRLEQGLAALPGVQRVGMVNALPLMGEGPQTNFAWDAVSEKRTDLSADWYTVSPHYFEVIGTRLLAGRFFTETDDANHPRVVIVDQTLAAHAWPGESAVGKKLLQFSRVDNDNRWYQVIGVVEHIRAHDLRRNVREQIYTSNQQEPDNDFFPVIQTSGAGAISSDQLQGEVAKLDPRVPIRAIRPLASYLAEAQAPMKFSLVLIAIFGAVALVMSMIGIYGVVSYSVTRRTQEIGLRIALGAQPADVTRMIVGQTLRFALVGLVAGSAAALVLTRLMADQLYGVSWADPVIHSLTALLLAGVVLASCYVPTRRAARVDPLVALRYE